LNPEEHNHIKEHALRAAAPGLYTHLIAELEKCHIHPYDIEPSVIEKESGLQLILRFGEGFMQSDTRDFTWEEIERQAESINEFFKEAGERCKKVLIADYYKMMKP
jgi:hypothetical protein